MIKKVSDRPTKKESLRTNIRNHYWIYIMLLPGLVCMFIFTFLPYYGITIAFKDFDIFASTNPIKAISASPWVGLANFRKIMGSSSFLTVFRNTIVINGLKILFVFPIPIITALFICELQSNKFRKFTQVVMFVPYFFSWVIIFGIFKSALGTYGIVNTVLQKIGMSQLQFFTDYNLFRFVLVFTDGWKNIGYNMIIFLAAILAIDPTLYEAATIDGANRWQQTLHVTLPGIASTMVVLLILRLGQIMSVGYEKIILMYGPSTFETGDVIASYVYRMGILNSDYSYSTAVNLFNSVVNLIVLMSANFISRKVNETSIW